MESEGSAQAFRLGVACATAGVLAFLLARLHAWPPHEDETLALFVGGQPLGDMFDTVLGTRGGAPLHFLIVHVVAAISPTLTALRLISVFFAVASIPVVALLLARLSDRRTALVATILVAASWVTLFHGIYGRMYSLFLFLATLSFLLLLRAIDDNRRSSWLFWTLAMLATIGSHQYAAFVFVIQAAYVLVSRKWSNARLLPAAVAFAVVAVAAVPVWRSTLVLAGRLDVGVGGEGGQLGGPWPVLQYIRSSLGDFIAGWTIIFALVCALAGVGIAVLARRRPLSLALTGLVFAVPAIGLTIASAAASASAPETRHLIFILPFFALLVAAGLVRVTRPLAARAWPAVALSLAALVAAEVSWGWVSTPTLYAGEPSRRTAAREAAEGWLAATSRPSDVLFGYDPLYLGAREKGGTIGETVVPRADAKLAAEALVEAPQPLGRGVWVLDNSDGSRTVSNWSRLLEIDERSPGVGFETRVFGPFIVVRTIEPTDDPKTFLADTVRVQRLYWDSERQYGIPNAGINLTTAIVAQGELPRVDLTEFRAAR
jgi:Dolichyl-phosphate-mannose-protein mannosyltransferase